MLERRRQAPAGRRSLQPGELRRGALRDQAAAARARAGAQVDHVIGAADRVLVVLDHHQRVALGAQPIERAQEHDVVARVQADGRLVQNVAHSLQIRTELRRQPDPLRLAAGEGGRGAVELQIAETHIAQEQRACGQLREQVAGNVELAAAQLKLAHGVGELLHRQSGERRDRSAAKQHMARDRVEPFAGALGADRRSGVVRLAPLRLLAALLLVEVGQLDSRAEAALAPAMPRIEGEQARVELGKAGSAVRAGALGRKHRRSACGRRRRRPRRPGCAPRRGRVPVPRPARRAAPPPGRRARPSEATGNSMLCSTNRSSRGHFAVGMSEPSTRSAAKPLPRAHFASAVYRPLRATISGASSMIFCPRYSLSSRAAIASADCGSIAVSQAGQYWRPSFTYSRRKK